MVQPPLHPMASCDWWRSGFFSSSYHWCWRPLHYYSTSSPSDATPLAQVCAHALKCHHFVSRKTAALQRCSLGLHNLNWSHPSSFHPPLSPLPRLPELKLAFPWTNSQWLSSSLRATVTLALDKSCGGPFRSEGFLSVSKPHDCSLWPTAVRGSHPAIRSASKPRPIHYLCSRERLEPESPT